MRPLPITSAILAAAFVGRATSVGPAQAPLDAAAANHVAAEPPAGCADDSAAVTTDPGGDGNAPAFVESGARAARSR